MRLHDIIVFVVMAACMCSCSKRPDGVLSEDDMIALIADIEIAEIYMQNHNSGYYNDSIKDSAIQWALDRHSLSKADFDSTMTWYGRNIDEFRDLYAKVDEELAKRQRRIVGESDQQGSSSDLWPYSRHIILSELTPDNGLSFSIQSDDLGKGDKIVWKMRPNGLSSGVAMLGVDYDNGTSAYSHQGSNGNRNVELCVQTDTALAVKRIFGYLRIKDSHSLPIWIDSIALESFPLDTTQYYRIYSQRKYSGPHAKSINDNTRDTIIDEDSKIGEILFEEDSQSSPTLKDEMRNKRPIVNKRGMVNKRIINTEEPLKAIPVSK